MPLLLTTPKKIFFIESKRYKYPKKNKEYIRKDIKRICDFPDELQGRIDISGYTYYDIILADVWTETKPKRNILNFYKNGNATKQDVIGFLKTDAESLSYLPDTIHLDEKNVNITTTGNKSYNLVSM